GPRHRDARHGEALVASGDVGASAAQSLNIGRRDWISHLNDELLRFRVPYCGASGRRQLRRCLPRENLARDRAPVPPGEAGQRCGYSAEGRRVGLTDGKPTLSSHKEKEMRVGIGILSLLAGFVLALGLGARTSARADSTIVTKDFDFTTTVVNCDGEEVTING